MNSETHREADPWPEVLGFLASRVAAPSSPRCRGRSSDALVTWTLAGGVPPASEGPRDRGDLAACERTVDMAPTGLASRMRPVVDRWRTEVFGEVAPPLDATPPRPVPGSAAPDRDALVDAMQRTDIIERSDLADAWRPASSAEAGAIADVAVGATGEARLRRGDNRPWRTCGKPFAHVAAAGGETPAPLCELPHGHPDGLWGGHDWLRGRTFAVVETDPETGEPLTTARFRDLSEAIDLWRRNVLARIATAAGLLLDPDDPDQVGTLEKAIAALREPEVVTGAEAAKLSPDIVGPDAMHHEATDHAFAIAIWTSGDGSVWVTEDGEIAIKTRFTGSYVSEWFGTAILAAEWWWENERPLARGDYVTGPVVAAELEKLAERYDGLGRDRIVITATDVAHLLRARAVELSGGNDTTNIEEELT